MTASPLILLEQVNVVVRVQDDDGLLPVAGRAPAVARPAGLALAVGRAHFQHLHVVDLLDRLLDLGLVGLGGHLERVGVAGLRTGACPSRSPAGG